MTTYVYIPDNTPLRDYTYSGSICKTCKYIAADWEYCEPLITDIGRSDDGFKFVKACGGYKKNTKRGE